MRRRMVNASYKTYKDSKDSAKELKSKLVDKIKTSKKSKPTVNDHEVLTNKELDDLNHKYKIKKRLADKLERDLEQSNKLNASLQLDITNFKSDVKRLRDSLNDEVSRNSKLVKQLSEKDILINRLKEELRDKEIEIEGNDSDKQVLFALIRQLIGFMKGQLIRVSKVNLKEKEIKRLGYIIGELKSSNRELLRTCDHYSSKIKELNLEVEKLKMDLSDPRLLIRRLRTFLERSNVTHYSALPKLYKKYEIIRGGQPDNSEHETVRLFGVFRESDNGLEFVDVNNRVYKMESDRNYTNYVLNKPVSVFLVDGEYIEFDKELKTDVKKFKHNGKRIVLKRKGDSKVEPKFPNYKVGVVGYDKTYYESLLRHGYNAYWFDPSSKSAEAVSRFIRSNDLVLLFYDSIPHKVLPVVNRSSRCYIFGVGYTKRKIYSKVHSYFEELDRLNKTTDF